MLTKPQMAKYADVLWWALQTARKKRFKKRDIILIRFDGPAVRLAEILQGRILDLGLNPVMRPGITPVMEHQFYEKAGSGQLAFLAPGEKELCGQVHGSIYLYAPDSLTHLSDIDSEKIGRAVVARKTLRDILNKREEAGAYSWTLCAFPTAELARQAKLSQRQFCNQIIRACFLNLDDPVGMWKRIHRDMMAIKKGLNRLSIHRLHITSASMDLTIKPGKSRKWIGLSGHNIPSFEIFLSPDWRGTEGIYHADQPSFRNGNLVQGVQLTFKKGVVIHAQARKGQAFLEKQLAMDKGASRVGEFSLTDKRFSKITRFMANTLYDENFGGPYGNCHLAVGASYSDTYDGNPAALTKRRKAQLGFNDSALHWDLVNTEKKTVTAHLENGMEQVIYKDGLFTV